MNDERSFSSVQNFHTHTHPAFGRVVSSVQAQEVKMRMVRGMMMR